MATRRPKPITYWYDETKIGKYKTTKWYQLVQTDTKKPKLSSLIKISKDQQFAKSSPLYWLELHDGKRFIKPRATGLFKTSNGLIYYGDIDNRTHSLLFRFTKNGNSLIIKYFEYYYTKDLGSIINFIK